MLTLPTYSELERRIEAERAHFQGVIPERNAIAWDGYLAALIEYGLISIGEHERLTCLLPAVEDNPVMAIFLGRNHG